MNRAQHQPQMAYGQFSPIGRLCTDYIGSLFEGLLGFSYAAVAMAQVISGPQRPPESPQRSLGLVLIWWGEGLAEMIGMTP